MRNTKLLLITLITTLIVWTQQGHSLDENTHDAINQYIAKSKINSFSLNDYLINNLGFKDGVEEPLFGYSEKYRADIRQPVPKWLGEGGVQEDRPGSITDYVSFKPTRSVKHFHNPLKSWDNAGLDDYIRIPSLLPPYFIDLHYTGQSSILWAQNQNQDPGGKWSWHDARKHYYTALTGRNIDGEVVAPKKEDRDPYFAKTFRAVGQLMHLVHDSSVPEHVRNDMHILPAYEAKVEEFRTNKTKYPLLWENFLANPLAFDKSILDIISTNPAAPVPISRIIDTDLYNGNNPDITKTNIGSGQPVGVAEYTNANFLSPDTMFTDGFDPEDRHYFPYPRRASAIRWKDDSNKRNYLGKTGEGDPVDHLAVESWFYFYRRRYFPQYGKNLPVGFDGKSYEEYASKLIPRAVGYSAGLLQYFFRGQLNVQATDKKPNGDIEIAIANLSDDPLVAGDFELYYDYKDGTRKKVDNLTPSHVEDLSKYDEKKPETIFKATFSPPNPTDFDSTKNGYYMLVYHGQLGGTKEAGGEKDAVIGKYQLIEPTIPVMVTYDPDEMKAFFKIGKRGEDETSHDFFIDLGPVLGELGHSVISPVSLKIVEYSGTLGALVYTVNETTYCVLMLEVLGLSSPEVEINGYKKRDFVWAYEEFDMSSTVLDPIPPIPDCSWGIPGRLLSTAYTYILQTRYPGRGDYYNWVLATGDETTHGGWEIHGPEGFEDLYWISNYYGDHLERTGVNNGTDPKTVAVPIGVSVWLRNKNGHLADIQWGIHFSCLAGYAFYRRNVGSYNAGDGNPRSWDYAELWRRFNVPFMLVKERGQDLVLNDPMNVFGSPWAVEFYTDIDPPGPITGEVDYDPPVPMRPPPTIGGWSGPEACYRTSLRASGSRWPGNYRHVYPILNLDGVLSRYAVHSTRMRYPYRWWDGANPKYTEFEEHYIDSLSIGTFENTVIGGPPWYTAHIYSTGIRPPGFFYDNDPYDLIMYAIPNGQFAHHAGGGNSNRMMLRIAPKSHRVSDYDAASGKDRSVYVIDGRVYDYDQPVPLLFGESKVSRELLVAQSIYGMNKPPVLDSTIDIYGDATLTGKIEGYLDLEGYDGYGYFSDFGIIKQSALE